MLSSHNNKIINSPIMCKFCKYFYGINTDKENPWHCKAFADGIPLKISNNSIMHNEPYPNAEHPTDNGIRFEPISEAK